MNRDAQHIEDRLIDFAVTIVELVEALPNSKAGNHIGNQLIRSGTSPAPNYAEAQSAESRRDFIHKLKIALKDLRETMIWLRIILRKGMIPQNEAGKVIKECGELIAIFASSAKTADANSKHPLKNPK
jgi:four helix bundle protein